MPEHAREWLYRRWADGSMISEARKQSRKALGVELHPAQIHRAFVDFSWGAA